MGQSTNDENSGAGGIFFSESMSFTPSRTPSRMRGSRFKQNEPIMASRRLSDDISGFGVTRWQSTAVQITSELAILLTDRSDGSDEYLL